MADDGELFKFILGACAYVLLYAKKYEVTIDEAVRHLPIDNVDKSKAEEFRDLVFDYIHSQMEII